MTTMSPEPQHARLTRSQRRWLALAVTFAVADLLAGLWLSLSNLTVAAAAHGWHPAVLLAVLIDLGIPTYVIADRLLIALGYRSWLPRLAAWSFAAATIVLNGAVSPDPAVLWRAAHMLAPAAWIVGIETLRLVWRALRKGERREADRAPVTEWLGAPRQTWRLWRRKLNLGVTGWRDMRALEEARLLVSDLASAREDTGQPVPAAVVRAVHTGRLPAHLAEAVGTLPATGWEPLVTDWAARQMALPETLLAAIRDASPEPPAEPAGTPSAAAPAMVVKTPSKARAKTPSRKTSPQRGRTMSPDELADYARTELGAEPVPSVNAIMKLAGVGRDKARDAHAILEMAGWAGRD